jgi:hypothetical protein
MAGSMDLALQRQLVHAPGARRGVQGFSYNNGANGGPDTGIVVDGQVPVCPGAAECRIRHSLIRQCTSRGAFYLREHICLAP